MRVESLNPEQRELHTKIQQLTPIQQAILEMVLDLALQDEIELATPGLGGWIKSAATSLSDCVAA